MRRNDGLRAKVVQLVNEGFAKGRAGEGAWAEGKTWSEEEYVAIMYHSNMTSLTSSLSTEYSPPLMQVQTQAARPDDYGPLTLSTVPSVSSARSNTPSVSL